MGVIDETLLPILQSMHNKNTWLHEKAICMCTDNRYYNYNGAYHNLKENSEQFQGGALFQLTVLNSSLKISSSDNNYIGIYELDLGRKYIPFFELSPQQSLIIIESEFGGNGESISD